MEKQYRIELFGGMRLRTDSRVIDRFPTQRAAALLAYLACYDRPLHRREVATAIWDTTEESALVSLRTALSSLRSAVESEPTPSLFLADRFTIRLNPETCSTDVLEFESALLAADRNSESASQHLQTAFDLYRGDFAAGLNEDPIPAKRERFRNSYHRTASRLADSIQDSDPTRARDILTRALDLAGYPPAGVARPRNPAAPPPQDAQAAAPKPAAEAPQPRGPYSPRSP